MGRLRCMLLGGGFDSPFGAPPVVHAHPVATAWPVLLVHGFGGTEVKRVPPRAKTKTKRPA